MKKVLLTLCGAVLLMALLTAPVLAQGTNYQTPMKCSTTGTPASFVEKGYAVILRPAGNLYISLKDLTSPDGTPFKAQIICFGPPQTFSPLTPAGLSAGAPGQLRVKVKGLATAPSLGTPNCRDIRIDVFHDVPGGEFCTEGFTP